MITTESVAAFDRATKEMTAKLPLIVKDMRDTADALERAKAEVDALNHEISTMNITMTDLRADKMAMDARIGALLQENARLEALLNNIGLSIKNSQQVQDGLAVLAAHRNGKVIEEPSARTMLADIVRDAEDDLNAQVEANRRS